MLHIVMILIYVLTISNRAHEEDKQGPFQSFWINRITLTIY